MNKKAKITKTVHNTVLDFVLAQDPLVQRKGLRALANSALAKCVGAITTHIRKQIPRDETSKVPGLDQRNQHDEDARMLTEADVMKMLGHDQEERDAMELAEAFHGVYHYCFELLIDRLNNDLFEDNRLKTFTTAKSEDLHRREFSTWERANTIEETLTFMYKSSQDADMSKFAKVKGMSPLAIRQILSKNDRNKKDQFGRMIPEILATVRSFGEGRETDIDTLPPVEQHQLAIKVHNGLRQAMEAAVIRAANFRSLDDIGDLGILDGAFVELQEWIVNFERRIAPHITDALNMGRNLAHMQENPEDKPTGNTAYVPGIANKKAAAAKKAATAKKATATRAANKAKTTPTQKPRAKKVPIPAVTETTAGETTIVH